ncbi:hypothetical protein NYQ35_16925 [Curtobacterium flaccumfaciens pv. flaccumfaciens]|jgi:hypothetical protein|uniref:hypothetical protein n=1 Tax=Curtobacterium TaxID=2034 RepID=UPI00217D72E0|nr:hypothetical protein [Curtobacterium flaccumfaciens]MCS6553264.1 hypothetical protein [Curtobacterium flaccumfaciens pv. flaccumfaciens]MCS6567084.1 hypothetical protein [Curtobacterium flaccumfaciens pv. flaccumfaciens]MCS6570486.1 hypothetical protein [Curtobacterium flaccumfaciens pv. flaccumfaciens]MCS6586831.1 hypothetical protein [Curtobacterium flaccumfaciens pv. flaccumfaciens]
MRKPLAITAALLAAILIAVIVIVIVIVRQPSAEQTTATPTTAASATTEDDDQQLQQLLNTRLSTIGAQLSVNLPATLTIDTANGDTVYARVTMHELTKLPAHQSAAILKERSALAGYDTVWTMPVSMTVLGIVDDAGTATRATADVSASDLSPFTIATHPGSDPLPTSNTLSSPGCSGLDGHTAIAVGHTVTWCVHGFSDAATSAPTGGQYETVSGTYATPITWASRKYAAPEIP